MSEIAYGRITGKIIYTGAHQGGRFHIRLYRRPEDERKGPPLYWTTADAPGEYSIDEIEEGQYVVLGLLDSEPEDHERPNFDAIVAEGSYRMKSLVHVRAGETVEKVDVVIQDLKLKSFLLK